MPMGARSRSALSLLNLLNLLSPRRVLALARALAARVKRQRVAALHCIHHPIDHEHLRATPCVVQRVGVWRVRARPVPAEVIERLRVEHHDAVRLRCVRARAVSRGAQSSRRVRVLALLSELCCATRFAGAVAPRPTG
eukprot:5911144-Prymnesium_polylepis.2